MTSSSSYQTKIELAYRFGFLFSFLEGTLWSTYFILDLTVGLVTFFLVSKLLRVHMRRVQRGGSRFRGSRFSQSLFASSGEEEEILTALIDALDILVEAALDRGQVASGPVISWII